MHISSSYAKILGEKLFRTWKIPRSGSKAKNGEEEERLNDGENNGQATHGARKHVWRTQAVWANFAGQSVGQYSLSKFIKDFPCPRRTLEPPISWGSKVCCRPKVTYLFRINWKISVCKEIMIPLGLFLC